MYVFYYSINNDYFTERLLKFTRIFVTGTVLVPCETGNTFLNSISIKFPADIITPELLIYHLQATLNRRTRGVKPVSLEKSNAL